MELDRCTEVLGRKARWQCQGPAGGLAGRPPQGPSGSGPELHDTAFGLVRVRVFEPQSLFGPVFFQVGELFAVDGSAPLPGETGQGGGQLGPGLATCPATCPAPGSWRPRSPVGLEQRTVPTARVTLHSHLLPPCWPSTPLAITSSRLTPDLPTSMVPTLPRPPHLPRYQPTPGHGSWRTTRLKPHKPALWEWGRGRGGPPVTGCGGA